MVIAVQLRLLYFLISVHPFQQVLKPQGNTTPFHKHQAAVIILNPEGNQLADMTEVSHSLEIQAT